MNKAVIFTNEVFQNLFTRTRKHQNEAFGAQDTGPLEEKWLAHIWKIHLNSLVKALQIFPYRILINPN